MQCLRHSHSGTLHHQIPALASKLQSSLITLGPRKAAVRRPQHGYSMNYKKKEGCVSCPIKTLHHSMYAPSIGQLTQPYGDGGGTTQPHAARTQRRVCMGLTLLSSSAAPANAHTTYPRSAPLTELPITLHHAPRQRRAQTPAPSDPRVSVKAAEQLNNVRPAQGRR